MNKHRRLRNSRKLDTRRSHLCHCDIAAYHVYISQPTHDSQSLLPFLVRANSQQQPNKRRRVNRAHEDGFSRSNHCSCVCLLVVAVGPLCSADLFTLTMVSWHRTKVFWLMDRALLLQDSNSHLFFNFVLIVSGTIHCQPKTVSGRSDRKECPSQTKVGYGIPRKASQQ
jgi:hypothetical protein